MTKWNSALVGSVPLAAIPFGWAHAGTGPYTGLAILLVGGILIYLVFLWSTAVVSFFGLIRAGYCYWRGKRGRVGLVLATLFMVPNLLGLAVYLYALCYPDGPKKEDIPILKGMGTVFLMTLVWFVLAILANRKARRMKIQEQTGKL